MLSWVSKAILPLKEHLGRSIKLGLVDLFSFTGSIFIRPSSSTGSIFRPDIASSQLSGDRYSLTPMRSPCYHPANEQKIFVPLRRCETAFDRVSPALSAYAAVGE